MKKTLLLLMTCAAFVACKKSETPPSVPPPSMQYTDYKDTVIRYTDYFQCDLNNDGITDFFFAVVPVYSGDVAHEEYRVGSSGINKIVLKKNDEIPQVYNASDIVGATVTNGFEWSSSQSGLIIDKVFGPGLDYWQGTWKDLKIKYLGIAVVKDGKTYYGWISISHNNNKVIVHKAALCKLTATNVIAGQ